MVYLALHFPSLLQAAEVLEQINNRKHRNLQAAQVGGSLGVCSERSSELLDELVKSHSRHGLVTDLEIKRIATKLAVSDAHVCGLATFYSLLKPDQDIASGAQDTESSQPTVIRICDGPVCRMNGCQTLIDELSQDVESNTAFSVKRTSCIGLCDAAPAAFVSSSNGRLAAIAPFETTHARKLSTLEGVPYPAVSQVHPLENRVLLSNVTGASSRSDIALRLEAPATNSPTENLLPSPLFRGEGLGVRGFSTESQYAALKIAIQLSATELVDRIESSGLRGRGGAGFATGKKWRFVAESKQQRRIVICNADESEPGTFKDRVLMENDPHLLLEGMTICGMAVGASEGIIYIRAEYPRAAETLQTAIGIARENNLLGENILGSAHSFDIKIHRGAGAYICGEETALLESLEGKRGEPRCRPPFPTTHGYFGFPTVVNNVETLCAVPSIIEHGSQFYHSPGRENRNGTKLFCLTGHVKNPGVYELPMGVTARELIFDVAGGIQADADFQFALCGGAAGMFINEEQLDVPLDYDSYKQGVPLGSGVLVVADTSVSLVEFLLWVLEFFENESCGKCTPCRVGTRQVREIVEGLNLAGASSRSEDSKELRLEAPVTEAPVTQRLRDLANLLKAASLCGLGQSVEMPIKSAMTRFPQAFELAKTEKT